VIGNHGAEWEQAGVVDVDPARLDPARTLLRAHAAELVALGAQAEDQGLSLAVRYRAVRGPVGALAFVRGLLARLPPGLEAFAGRRVLNVVPGGAPDKGDALLRLAAAAFFIDTQAQVPLLLQAMIDPLTARTPGRLQPRPRARRIPSCRMRLSSCG
jgi:hypothetical protein